MAIPAYMTIEGGTQGDISAGALSEDSVGTAAQEGHEDEIMVYALDHNVPRATNVQSGQITGLPEMKAMSVMKMLDKSSPLLHNALCSGEQLNIEINWFRVSGEGGEEHYYTMEIENAVLVDIKTNMPNVADPDNAHLGHMETIYFTFNSITWSHEVGGTEGTYKFGAGAG